MIGAAWATLISFVGSFFLYSFRAAKYLKIVVQWKKVLGVLFIIIIALVATLLSPFSGIFIVVCTKVAILSVVIVIMLKSNLFFRLECIHLLRHYRKLFNQ